MKKDGKALEKLVTFIHEAIKNQNNTTVFSNSKLKASNGVMREIDVLIKSEVNETEILIAIECKDYSRPVDIKEMDAFKTKCDSIPSINKMIFVSTNGYTIGAVSAAEFYGIETYLISELDKESVSAWLPLINVFKLKVDIIQLNFRLSEKQVKSDKTKLTPYLYDDTDENIMCDLSYRVNEIVKINFQKFWEPTLSAFMEYQNKVLTEGIIKTYEYALPSTSYMKSSKGEKLYISSILIDLRLSLIQVNTEIDRATSYGKFGKEITTKQVSLSIGVKTKADIIQISHNYNKINIYNDD